MFSDFYSSKSDPISSLNFSIPTYNFLKAWLHGEFQPTGLKYCFDYMVNFSLGAKRKFPWESLLRYENIANAHARVAFSARAKVPFRLHETFLDFQARLVGLKILARFENTGLGFSARAESFSM